MMQGGEAAWRRPPRPESGRSGLNPVFETPSWAVTQLVGFVGECRQQGDTALARRKKLSAIPMIVVLAGVSVHGTGPLAAPCP